MTIMKKILTVLVLTVLVLSLTFSASAADEVGAFVQSPSANLAPEIIEGDSDEHNCDQDLVITAYADRDKLSEDVRKSIEKAYVKITGVRNLTTICGALKDLANEKGIPTLNLAVSDLFDISDVHGSVDAKFDIVIKAETLENFVGLLHYKDGKFELIKDAKVEEINGETHLSFSTDGLSPFAIVVDTGEELPAEDNSVLVAILTVVAVAEAAVLVAILVKFILSKKLA